jgi:hypothetical protein
LRRKVARELDLWKIDESGSRADQQVEWVPDARFEASRK